MKRSCTITIFAVLMLCITSSPCKAETINPDSTTTNPIYQLVSVSKTPTPSTTSRNKYILVPLSLPPASLINQKESRTLVTGIFDKSTNKDEGKKLFNHINQLEDNEDVQNISSNYDISKEVFDTIDFDN